MNENELHNLPRGWVWVSLRNIINVLEAGGRPKGGVKEYKDGIPSIGGEHLSYNGGFNFANIRYVPHIFFEKMLKGIIKKDDILIVKDGATTGKVSFVDDSFPFDKSVINEHVFRLTTFAKYINPKYLFLYLYSNNGNSQILDSFQGSAQGGINQSFVDGVNIPLAPLSEQNRIVAKIESLFERLNKAKKELAEIPPIIKRFKQSVLAKTFRGELVEQNPNDEPAKILLDRIKEERKNKLGKKYKEPKPIDTTELPELPDGWEWVRLQELLIEIKPGFACGQRDNNGFVQLRMNNISTEGKIITDSLLKVPAGKIKIEQYILKSGDILFNNTNNPELIGKTSIFEGEIENCVYSNHITRLRTVDTIDPKWLNYYLVKEYNLGTFQIMCHRFVGQAGISTEKILSIVVGLPPLSEQHRIVAKIEELFKYADSIESAVKSAQEYCDRLTQSILAKAFRGELVPQDPNDEPASVLLEKIQNEKKKIEEGNKKRK